ncbi:hypothetical protein AMTRI_Chr02g262550 [Amborella trichopoda]
MNVFLSLSIHIPYSRDSFVMTEHQYDPINLSLSEIIWKNKTIIFLPFTLRLAPTYTQGKIYPPQKSIFSAHSANLLIANTPPIVLVLPKRLHIMETVRISNLSFTYPGIDGQPPPGTKPLIHGFSLSVNSGDRCLLVGSNGAGKTTILKILGGKHMVEPDMVHVLGRSAFHDTSLTSSGDLCYLGGEWRRDVAFAGFEVPIQMDISAEKMIYGMQGIDPQRRETLLKVLDIDLNWRMHKASDGQRRRVQICMGLLKPFKVLLLDEITVDLDVLARADLLKFLKRECEERGATIIYATHIFDGLEDWPSHILYVAHGELQLASPMEKVKEMSNLSLMRTVECWLRRERDEERERRKGRKAKGLPEFERRIEGTRVTGDPARSAVRVLNNGWAAGRLHSTVAGEENFVFSSNSVLR